jgi:hypothetical protein
LPVRGRWWVGQVCRALPPPLWPACVQCSAVRPGCSVQCAVCGVQSAVCSLRSTAAYGPAAACAASESGWTGLGLRLSDGRQSVFNGLEDFSSNDNNTHSKWPSQRTTPRRWSMLSSVCSADAAATTRTARVRLKECCWNSLTDTVAHRNGITKPKTNKCMSGIAGCASMGCADDRCVDEGC